MEKNLLSLSFLFFLPLCSLTLAQSPKVGVNTDTPQKTLHVDGSLQITNELNLGGTKNTAGSAGISGQVLISKGNNTSPTWETLDELKGAVSGTFYAQGTVSVTVNPGSTADVPGITGTFTVPSGKTQTFLIMILGYARASTNAYNLDTQGVFSLLQNGIKISSAFTFSTSASQPGSPNPNTSLVNLSAPVNFFKAVTLPAGTYTFKVQYTSWSGTQVINHIPSEYGGYNGDNEAMLTKMQVFVFSN
ncbi:hypothetical protein ACM46_13485 [Chryseobacterium angstadtii]|uniref:DUF4397 domain-containing protein n=1 Tax=Chryseobacterium angstadtii TaxID=558151 RepID=A0A0J7L149_9FLAO|nr:hypothetical protein [Chryseobacterium angstadtii]KMQ62965.1 hypothetical protein ACM46_13485 [Chryseobacterium angstadtii]